MSIESRLLKYVSIDTTSNEVYEDKPSNDNEFILANILKDELTDLGLKDIYINKFATVYGYLDGNNMYTIGPRGVIGREWFDYVKEKNINLFTSNYIKEKGILNIVNKIKEKNRNKKIKFYITFDIDCLDVSYVFGTGTPQCNGLTPYECDEALRNLHDLDIAGFDIVELNPKLDDSHTSFVIAEELLYHFLAFGLNKENLK